ncbi:MAG TPA: diguanylate cyclase [Dongiaceae bacterium]|nr:diguanylate cyclase [Dongiaceae bacterium]
MLRLILVLLLTALGSAVSTTAVSNPAASASPVYTQSIKDQYLGRFSEYRQDDSRTLSLDDLLQDKQSWTALNADSLTPGFSHAAWWLRVQLHNDSTIPQQWILDTGTALVDFLDIYTVRSNGEIASLQTGDRRPFATRPMPTRTIVMPLTLAAGESIWIYLRLDTYDGLHEVVSPRLISPADQAGKLQGESLTLGLYYGTLSAVLLYNLFLYISTRERGFRLYIVYVAAFLFWGFVFRGYGLQYLWPQSPVLNNQILPFAAGICYCTFGLFVLEYLSVKRDAPRWLYLTNRVAVFSNVLTLLPPLLGYYALSFALSVPTGILIIICSTSTGALLLRRGSRPARYFLLAFTLLALGVVLYYIQLLGWVPANPVSEYGVQVGSGLEVLLLAFGLADQMNALKADKLRAEQEARAAQLALNTQLASEVQQRTKELELANQRLNELAITDELTGAYNRRHFNQQFEQAFANHLRLRTPFALCMIDIDHFKLYNDTYGHQAGDEVLQQISRCLASRLQRSNDFLFRLGGEEFAILLSVDNPPAKCMPFVDSLRKAIEQLSIVHSGNAAGVVTASFGLLTLDQPSDLQRAAEVYARTDELLYQAKTGGRNRVVHQAS